jgi:hypothetical protein
MPYRALFVRTSSALLLPLLLPVGRLLRVAEAAEQQLGYSAVETLWLTACCWVWTASCLDTVGSTLCVVGGGSLAELSQDRGAMPAMLLVSDMSVERVQGSGAGFQLCTEKETKSTIQTRFVVDQAVVC